MTSKSFFSFPRLSSSESELLLLLPLLPLELFLVTGTFGFSTLLDRDLLLERLLDMDLERDLEDREPEEADRDFLDFFLSLLLDRDFLVRERETERDAFLIAFFDLDKERRDLKRSFDLDFDLLDLELDRDLDRRDFEIDLDLDRLDFDLEMDLERLDLDLEADLERLDLDFDKDLERDRRDFEADLDLSRDLERDLDLDLERRELDRDFDLDLDWRELDLERERCLKEGDVERDFWGDLDRDFRFSATLLFNSTVGSLTASFDGETLFFFLPSAMLISFACNLDMAT